MAYIGKTPASAALTSSDISDGIIITDKLANNAVVSSKITDATISNADVNATVITGQSALTSVASDDTVLISDTSASGALKKMTRANFVSGVGESNTPSFWAKGDGATSLSNNTGTTIAVQSEGFDNGGCYNNTSSSATLNGLTVPAYSFVPNVAGLYYFTGAIKLNTTSFDVGLVNNRGNAGGGESFAALVYHRSGVANNMVMVSGFSLMNGSGNSICLYGYQTSGGTISTNDAIYTTYFGGFLVKKS